MHAMPNEEHRDWRRQIAASPLQSQLLSDAELDASVAAALAQRRGSGDVWLFGYGSLLWNPQVKHHETRVGVVHGYHRGLYLWSRINRGTPQRPGLVLAVDRGGCCTGVAFRISAAEVDAELRGLWRREMMLAAYHPRWLPFRSGGELLEALTFVVNRKASGYARALSEAEMFEALCHARGRYGSCAEYVRRTVDALRAYGLHDRRLEKLCTDLNQRGMSPG
jgi:cation transport protein ChaC